MCVFLYMVTKSEISEDVKARAENHDFCVSDVQSYLLNKPDRGIVYSIDRQCACDFFNGNDYYNEEIKSIVISEAKKQGEVILIKTDDETTDFLITKYKSREININDFLTLYPDILESDYAYTIRE